MNRKMRMVCYLICTVFVAVASSPRNVLFILVDDLGCTDLGYAGSTLHETPNIDALAEAGMSFDQGYAASQVCSPSRASILLGKTPARHGITQWIGDKTGLDWDKGDPLLNAEYVRNLPHTDTTLAEAFQDAGYVTFFAGKWHLGAEGSWPEDHGFMINKGGWSVGSPQGGFFAPWENPRLESGPEGEALTLRLARETAEFIGSVGDKPFFAFLSFYSVHAPIQTTKPLWKKYRNKAETMGLTGAATRFAFDRRLPVRQVQDNPVYAGMMEMLDDAVGIVLEKLKEAGLDQNTVVVFTSDNGGVSSGDSYSTSLLPYRGGKGRQWEGGIREPFIIHVPGMTPAGSRSEVPVIGMDFYPTLLELTGIPFLPEQHIDGISLVKLLQGKSIPDRDLFWHYPHYGNQGGEPSSIIRRGDWKLIFYHEDGRNELYNLKNDIGEQQDLAAVHPEITDRLRARLDSLLAESGAILPVFDNRYSKERFDARLKNKRTSWMEKLETSAESCLQADWLPGQDWWGSSPVYD